MDKNSTFLGHFIKILGHIRCIATAISAFCYTYIAIGTESITTLNELPIGLIYAIHKSENTLWLGGENGLFAINGNNVRYLDQLGTEFDGADIEGITEDIDGTIWFATFGKGIYKVKENGSKAIIIERVYGTNSNFCRHVKRYSNGIIASCGKSIYFKNSSSSKFENIVTTNVYNFTDITSLEIDGEKIYFIDDQKFLYLIENNSVSKKNFNLQEEYQLNYLFSSSKNRLWIAYSGGLSYINDEDEIVSFQHKLISDKSVTRISESSENELLIFSQGFLKLTEENSHIQIHRIKSLSKYDSLKINAIESLDDGNFVFSVPIYGLVKYTKLLDNIEFLKISDKELFNIQFSYFFKGNLLLAKEENLYKYNFRQEKVELLSENIGFVNYLTIDNQENLIISSDELGLLKISDFNSTANISKEILYLPKGGYINSLANSNDRDIIFGVVGGEEPGLFQYSEGKGTQKLYSDIHPDIVMSMDDESFVSAVRFKGILFEDDFGRLSSIQSNQSFVSSHINNCLLEDKDGIIWVCTDGAGLGYYDPNLDKTVFIDPKYTLGSKYIRELVEDTEGYLWIMTNRGMLRYDKTKNVSIKIGKEDGISDVDFEITASINLNGDTILVAGDTKNYIIDTKQANKYLNHRLEKETEAILVNLEVTNRDTHVREERNLDLQKALEGDDILELENDEILFSLKMAANDFIDRNYLGFHYRLIGLDENWIKASPFESTISYSTLPSGDYTFEFKVDDPKSIASQPVSSLRIKVLPPFWQTWQAYIIYVLLCIIATILFFKYRTYQLHKINTFLEASIVFRTIELAKSQHKIGNLLTQKESFFAHASHELKTPLSLISGPLEKLKHDLSTNSHSNLLNIIDRNTKRLSLLVGQILDLAKLDAKAATRVTTYALNESISTLIESFKSIAKLKSQTTEFIKNDSEIVVTLLEDSLEKIVSNLVLNAIKYTPNNGHISVKLQTNTNWIKLSVSDNGIGIAKKDHITIFKRFTRLKSSTENSGSGLGLAVVQELVNANEGIITVDSDLGRGSKFVVSFPKTKMAAEASIDSIQTNCEIAEITTDFDIQDEEKQEITNLEKQELTVLVVEDNQDMRNFIVSLVSSSYKCISARNGVEGLTKAKALLPDLIVSDLMMPEMDGFCMSESIRNDEITCHIPIIILTAKGDDQNRLEGWKHNVDDFIAKPFNNEELLLRIANLLQIRNKITSKIDHTGSLSTDTIITQLTVSEYYSERDIRFFNKFVAMIETHYVNEKFNRKSAADLMAVSERQLNRKLTALINMAFNEYLRKFRLDTAKKALIAGKQITEVSFDVGFTTPTYFSSCFKKEYGLTPKGFIDSLKRDEQA